MNTVEITPSPEGWSVACQHGTGTIKWVERERVFSFYPSPDFVIQKDTWTPIALFMRERTKERRA